MVPPQNILDFLQRFDNYIIATHREPDGDCVGASMALASFLQRRNKQVTQINPGPFDRHEIRNMGRHFVSISGISLTGGACPIFSKKDWGLVMLDCNTPKRLGAEYPPLKHLMCAVIDHHIREDEFSDVYYTDEQAPATGVLVYNIIEAFNYTPTRAEAQWLLFAIMSDTGFLRHSAGGSTSLLAVIAQLCAAGATLKSTYGKIYGGHDLTTYQLLARHLERVETHFNGALLLTWESEDDHLELGAEYRDTDMLYRILLSITGCEAIAFIRAQDENNRCNVSLRALERIDVRTIASEFGGGGHRLAAGFESPLPLEQARAALLECFAKQAFHNVQ